MRESDVLPVGVCLPDLASQRTPAVALVVYSWPQSVSGLSSCSLVPWQGRMLRDRQPAGRDYFCFFEILKGGVVRKNNWCGLKPELPTLVTALIYSFICESGVELLVQGL